jgi:hypothetical protein
MISWFVDFWLGFLYIVKDIEKYRNNKPQNLIKDPGVFELSGLYDYGSGTP